MVSSITYTAITLWGTIDKIPVSKPVVTVFYRIGRILIILAAVWMI
jgi:hypothetical protein